MLEKLINIPTPDSLEIGKIDTPFQDSGFIPQIQLYKDEIPMSARQSFTLDEIIKWVEEAIEDANKVIFIVKWFIDLFNIKQKTVKDFSSKEIQRFILDRALLEKQKIN